MKNFSLIFWAMMLTSSLFSQTIADFENLSLATDTFWDGSDLTGGFASGNARFVNDYNTSFQSWSGFTYSNKKDTVTAGSGNQYSAITGAGCNGSVNYAIADEYGNAKIMLTGNAAGKMVKGFNITNTTYAYQSLKNGDMFSKKFGGATGMDPDWFNLRILAWHNGVLKSQLVDFLLADFRSADTTQDYIVRDWRWIDLRSLGDVDSLLFKLSSSDTSSWGMNTPAYFAMDNFTTMDTAYAQPAAHDDVVDLFNTNDTVISILANDVGLVAGPLAIELVGLPLISGATDSVINNQIHYWPAVSTVGTDTLIYRVCDDLNACSTGKVILHITGISGMAEFSETSLQIYPNPFSNRLNVSGTHLYNSFELYDLRGALVKGKAGIDQSKFELNTADLSPGIYLLKTNSGQNTTLKKVVKE